MTHITKRRDAGAEIWHSADMRVPPDNTTFDPRWLQASGFVVGHSAGRNRAHFLRIAGQGMVLRHYYRGGWIGRVISDLFLRTPVADSRAMAEFTLLQWMRDQGLPVPTPLAARYVPAGPWYRADLITERIAESRTLADWLAKEGCADQTWGRIGQVIARMHGLGVDHTDLNCRNILLDAQGKVWLIDFDKCRRRPPGAWQQRNLARLRRSLDKEKAQAPGLIWFDDDWQALLAGYEGAAA